MTRYYKECETCKDDMQRAYCSYCEKPLIEASQREKQFEAMRKLLAELASDKSQSWEDDYKDEIYWRNRAARLLATITKDESMKG